MSQQTPNFQIPFPEPADPADVPADLEALARRLDVLLLEPGVPTALDVQSLRVSGATTLGQLIATGLAQLAQLTVDGRRVYPPIEAANPPANPQNGDEWILVVDPTVGIVWRFRYRAAAALPYRWEFVGGSPNKNEILGQQVSTSSTTPVDLGGPVLTVPRAGDYIVRWGASPFGPPTGNPNLNTDLFVAGVFPGNENRLFWNNSSGQHQGSGMREITLHNLAAGTELRLRYSVQSGTGYWNNRTLYVQPIRVS
jgi:hypothetical protein